MRENNIRTSKLYGAFNRPNKGLGGQDFILAFYSNTFKINDIITGNLLHGDSYMVISNPHEYAGLFLYRVGLVGKHITVDCVANEDYLKPETEFIVIDEAMGEFDPY